MGEDNQVQDLEAPEPGQEPGTVQGVQPGQVQPEREPEYVTRQNLDERFSKFEKSLQRMLQSNRDSTVSRVENVMKQMREQGYTEEEITEARKRARVDDATDTFRKAISEPEYEDAQPTLAPDQVGRMMAEISDKHGAAIFVGDPEAKMLDAINPYTLDEDGLRSIYEQAILKKKARLTGSQPPQEPPEQPPHNPAARTPGLTGGTVTGDRLTQLTSELQDIQSKDPWNNNKELSKRRAEILRELRGG